MGLQFGVFDHIEPVPWLPLDQIYKDRLEQIELLDAGGFYAYHLAEHHTPAVHSLAPSQNVFLAAVSQRTSRLRFGPGVYVLPLHHPIRLIEEISMLDHLSDGRLEIGVGRGGVLEAYFWGQDSDVETNYNRYCETLAIIKEGLSHEQLTYHGDFYQFDDLPMRLRPKQAPYPPFWYMRNVETAALDGMSTILVGTLDEFAANVQRYRALWKEYQGDSALTIHGSEPKIGLVVHLVVAETDQEAVAVAQPAWEQYRWNLGTPRRLEAERHGLTQFLGDNAMNRPRAAPPREARRDLYASIEGLERQRSAPDGVGTLHSNEFGVLAGSPDTVREYLERYMKTGANYFVGSFQWGSLKHEHAMRSIELFAGEVMPHYVEQSTQAGG